MSYYSFPEVLCMSMHMNMSLSLNFCLIIEYPPPPVVRQRIMARLKLGLTVTLLASKFTPLQGGIHLLSVFRFLL